MIQVTVVAAKTEARLTITPEPEKHPVTIDQLLSALRNNNVTFGISRKHLFAIKDKFNRHPEQPASTIIARGRPPEATIQPQYHFHFATRKHSGLVSNRGRINYKNRGVTRYFAAGDILLEIIPGRPGRPGRLVDGSTINPEPLKPLIQYRAGTGVALERSPKRLLFRARTPGQAQLLNHTLTISEILHHDGNVDLETGHIEFAGPVEISGNLLAGFHIFSKSTVKIGRTASGTVRTQSDLTVSGGIVGSEKEKILAGGNLICEYISGVSQLRCGGNVIVNKHIINSNLEAAGKVICEEMITGQCHIIAFSGVVCAELGSDQGSWVTVEIGNPAKYKEKIARINEFMEPLIQQSINLVDELGLQVLMSKDITGLPPERQPEAEKKLKTYLEIESHVTRLKEKRNELENKIAAGLKARVTVKKYAHPGNTIKIGLESYTIENGLSGPLDFYFDEKRKTITFERLS